MLGSQRFVSRILPPKDRREAAWWFAFQQDKLLIQSGSHEATIPCLVDFAELELPILRQHYLGCLGNCHCYAAELVDGITPPKTMTFEGLRQVYGRMDEDLFSVACRAVQIIEWDRTHEFCGRCGARTRIHATERAKECPECGLLHFPHLAPAIIVLVARGREMLLARARRFHSVMYSTLAGFVEAGETLEEAVVREVQEETGITVGEITYFGSQPWPFPHSLMIGFTANYADGEIGVNDEENIDVGWFTADNLPPLPDKISIARRLIDGFLDRQAKQAP